MAISGYQPIKAEQGTLPTAGTEGGGAQFYANPATRAQALYSTMDPSLGYTVQANEAAGIENPINYRPGTIGAQVLGAGAEFGSGQFYGDYDRLIQEYAARANIDPSRMYALDHGNYVRLDNGNAQEYSAFTGGMSSPLAASIYQNQGRFQSTPQDQAMIEQARQQLGGSEQAIQQNLQARQLQQQQHQQSLLAQYGFNPAAYTQQADGSYRGNNSGEIIPAALAQQYMR